MESAIVSAAVALIVALLVQVATRSREVAADARRYRMERANELRVAYASAIQLARDLLQSSRMLVFIPPGETTASAFSDRVTGPYAESRAAYAKHLGSLLLSHDGAVVERLVDVMWRDLFVAQNLAVRQFSERTSVRDGVNFDKILELEKAIEKHMHEVTEHCRRSLRAMEPDASPLLPPSKADRVPRRLQQWWRS
jgi:hypothetical protein